MVAIKYDDGKVMLQCIDPLAELELGEVLTFGAREYGENNWREGFVYSRVVGALRRHLNAFLRGEDRDPKSGRLHTAHIMACSMFLTNFQLSGTGTDDRIKPLRPIVSAPFGRPIADYTAELESRDNRETRVDRQVFGQSEDFTKAFEELTNE